MAELGKVLRENAEDRFDRIRKVATDLTEAERHAVRQKTTRLRALRRAKEESARPGG